MSQRPGRVVTIVTGAGRGLGRQIAVALAARGDALALVARSDGELRESQRIITGAGGIAECFPTDVGDPHAVAAMSDAVRGRMGAVSVLINAAGMFGPIRLIKDTDPRQWLQVLTVNVAGPFLTSSALLQGMLDQGWGRIVNVSSAAALHPPGQLSSAYATSKAALNRFTRQLAAEVAGTGVTANAIHPGEVKTEMWTDIRDQVAALGPEAEGFRKWVSWVESTGGDDPRKTADLALKLTGSESGDVNGQFLWIEGGLQTPIPSWEPP